MSDLFDGLSDDARALLRRCAHPGWMSPMFATLARHPFSDDAWVYERKLDGVRCVVVRDGGSTRLVSRNGNPMNDTYPELVEAAARITPAGFIADGEVVAFDGSLTSFARLQKRLGITDPDTARAGGVAVYLYLFDLMYVAGHDLTRLPLVERKAVLRKLAHVDDPVCFTAQRNGDGAAYYDEACEKGWEGLIAKRADSAYTHGRSTDWLKLRCANRQEFVIGGFTDPGGSRVGFGALLIGYHDNGDFRFAGKVGTGFDHDTLRALRGKMDRLERASSPFAGDDAPAPGKAHWITPTLVGEVAFTEWTRDGKLRHPRFVGLRHDKDPGDVVREVAGA